MKSKFEIGDMVEMSLLTHVGFFPHIRSTELGIIVEKRSDHTYYVYSIEQEKTVFRVDADLRKVYK